MIKKTIKDHKRIIFNGNGYDDAWIREAVEERGLLNYRTTADCMPHLLDQKNVDMLTSLGVFTMDELYSRRDIMLENYCKSVEIEACTMSDMVRTLIIPAMEAYAADMAGAAASKRAIAPALKCGYEAGIVTGLSELADTIAVRADELDAAMEKLHEAADIVEESAMIRDTILPLMDALRAPCDKAELMTAKSYWPFPTYGDLLFGVH
jgi:glutamine synthetase